MPFKEASFQTPESLDEFLIGNRTSSYEKKKMDSYKSDKVHKHTEKGLSNALKAINKYKD